MHLFVVLVGMVRKDYEKLFTNLTSLEPPIGLFDRIILAIKREQELQNTKRLVLGFLVLLIVSLTTTPFSWVLVVGQMQDSGVVQFIQIALSDIGTFFASWQEFSLAIAESLPVMSIAIFTINMILAVFTLRLFLYKKRLLVGYLIHTGNLT